jgi:hypothetical protein
LVVGLQDLPIYMTLVLLHLDLLLDTCHLEGYQRVFQTFSVPVHWVELCIIDDFGVMTFPLTRVWNKP